MFSEMDSAEEEQSLMREEMNKMLKNMEKEELKLFFSKEEFDEDYKLIELKQCPFEKALMLLKHAGFENAKEFRDRQIFTDDSLKKRFERMIAEEGKKIEGKDEKLLTDLCECYIFWLLAYETISDDLLVICVRCLLIAALNKEESEEIHKEVEMAFFALSYIGEYSDVPEELYFMEMIKIIQYHQEHENLTRLAYQSAWEFLINRLHKNKNLEDIFVIDLHFVKEATRELKELTRSVDWKIKDEDKRGKDKEETMIIKRWVRVLQSYFYSCDLWGEEHVELVRDIVQIFRAGNECDREVCDTCVDTLTWATFNRAVNIYDLLKNGAAEVVFSKMNSSNEKFLIIDDCERFFKNVCERLNEKMESEREGESENESEKAKRKETKKKVIEKMEEEGYEDCIVKMRYFKTVGIFGDHLLIKNIEDYYLW
ncbi:uncharacterized protein MONOS_8895 [Monocercomonoides exilis]|uniref:uncharacterized protein n=1 Tax=Monocercomonoides exilis TaxID=2049356 RepID=UPI00355A7962|nr:hypothetical protein MONOS_8895 [Monocercomonoides exilis]|eukprot:MONOS_8895.1-p1 / transcript=MONOS_8895.1 / gene=MONOS_8895 / organism=Monocercomonoides_exilis_PA203 / gene_product=unspecified product / transcript_product=unspecified product / location=Mono_scaffold00349:32051-33391(+) / protein_length=427 / sequence_SO=supercontig / SO=protein_coding / is_pseudo=false